MISVRVGVRKLASGMYRTEVHDGLNTHLDVYSNLGSAIARIRAARDTLIVVPPFYLYYIPKAEPAVVLYYAEKGIVASALVLESKDAQDAWFTFEVYAQMMEGT